MKEPRKISLVINSVHQDDEDRLDVLYWRNCSPKERLAEVFRLRQDYFNWKDGYFPNKIEKVVTKRKL